MTKHVLVEMDDEDHRRARRKKNRYGMTWADVFFRGLEGLEDPGEADDPGSPPEPEE